MVTSLLKILRWYLSLSRRFFRVVPAATVLVVLATLVSQISKLLAFFLPLKVMILLGSDRIPRYFPPAFAEFDRDMLIVALCISTVVFYGLHLLAERVIGLGTDYGSRRLQAKSQVLALFENQDELAANGYQRYTEVLAGGVFVVLAWSVLWLFYRDVSLLVAGYVVLAAAAIWLAQKFSLRLREKLDETLGGLVKILGAVGFLMVFAWLVADFVYLDGPASLLLAIIALLLSRQMFNRAARVVNAISGLNRQRPKLDVLYFHGKVLLPDERKVDKSIWPMLMPERRLSWVEDVMAEFVPAIRGPVSCRWHQLGVVNVTALRVYPAGSQSGYLIKLFDANRTKSARHEATLLAAPPRRLPAPPLLGVTQVRQFHCHVYQLPASRSPTAKETPQVIVDTRIALLAVKPPVNLARRYLRSRPMFWQYLGDAQLERLRVAADGRSLEVLEQFIGCVSVLEERLEALPLVFVNPSVNRGTVLLDEEDKSSLLHWGGWGLAPLGASWPTSREALAGLGEAIASAAQIRANLADVQVPHAEQAALAQALVKQIQQQRYADALKLLPRILKRL